MVEVAYLEQWLRFIAVVSYRCVNVITAKTRQNNNNKKTKKKKKKNKKKTKKKTKARLFKYIEHFTTKKKNFQIKNPDIFHISSQNIDCGYLLEPPR